MIEYLFPYSQVPVNSKIVLYGMGDVGPDYLKQLKVTGYCEVVAVIDRNYTYYQNYIVPVIPCDKINDLNFDYVVLALKTEAHVKEIKRILATNGVPENKIIFWLTQNIDNISISADIEQVEYAYSKSDESVMIKMTGGIGDVIARAPFVYEIIKNLPNCLIDLVGLWNTEFADFLFIECKNINVISSGNVDMNNYKLAITLTPRDVRIEKLDISYNWTERNDFLKKLAQIHEKNKSEVLDYRIPYYVYWKKYEYLGMDCYSSVDRYSLFDIDYNVPIPFLDAGEKAFLELGLNEYITIGGGNGTSADGKLIAKSWPKENFEELIARIKEEFTGYTIVQIGAEDVQPYKGIDKYLFGKSFDLIAWVLKKTKLHIDIEGGMVHLASQIGTKCVVLFGPTSVKYFGYSENLNICMGKCEPCCGLYGDGNHCARNLDQPECMNYIIPSMVYEEVCNYLKELDKKLDI